MEKDGLVERVKDLDRKNLVRISITEKGHQAYRESTRREPIHRILLSLSEDERRQLKSLLLKLRDTALEEIRHNLDQEEVRLRSIKSEIDPAHLDGLDRPARCCDYGKGSFKLLNGTLKLKTAKG